MEVDKDAVKAKLKNARAVAGVSAVALFAGLIGYGMLTGGDDVPPTPEETSKEAPAEGTDAAVQAPAGVDQVPAEAAGQDLGPWAAGPVRTSQTADDATMAATEKADGRLDMTLDKGPAEAAVATVPSVTLDNLADGSAVYAPGWTLSTSVAGSEVLRDARDASAGLRFEDTAHIARLPKGTYPLIAQEDGTGILMEGKHVAEGYINLTAGTYRFDLLAGSARDHRRGLILCEQTMEIGEATVLPTGRRSVGEGNATSLRSLDVVVPEGKEGLYPFRLETSCQSFVRAPSGTRFSNVDGGNAKDWPTDKRKLMEYYAERVSVGEADAVSLDVRVLEPGEPQSRPLGSGDLFRKADDRAEPATPLATDLKPGSKALSWYGELPMRGWLDGRAPLSPGSTRPSAVSEARAGEYTLFDGSGNLAVRRFEGVLAVREDGPHTLAAWVRVEGDKVKEGRFEGTRTCAEKVEVDGRTVIAGQGVEGPRSDRKSEATAAYLRFATLDLRKGLVPYSVTLTCAGGMDGRDKAKFTVRTDVDGRIGVGEPDVALRLGLKGPSDTAVRPLGADDAFVPESKAEGTVGLGGGKEASGVLTLDQLMQPAPKAERAPDRGQAVIRFGN